jgi:hypothetical protein
VYCTEALEVVTVEFLAAVDEVVMTAEVETAALDEVVTAEVTGAEVVTDSCLAMSFLINSKG